MDEFFGFMIQVVFVFVFMWWLGVNFFKHSHEIGSWIKKRKLQKLADENRDSVVDTSEVFKREFGFLDSAEYLKKRIKEIKSELLESNREGLYINALEFIFLVDELETQVLKTDRGVYIVSMKSIRQLLLRQEEDTIYYAKKIRQYALRFLPKPGEPIVLNADEVLYWIRTGMLKRPDTAEGNRVFNIKSSMQEVCMNLREDFTEPHYSISIVKHDDFQKLSARREQRERQTAEKEKQLEKIDELSEGVMVLFSDNTMRMKIGELVYITNSQGITWKEDLRGNKIEDSSKKKNQNENNDTFIEKTTKAMSQEAEDSPLVEAKVSVPLMHDSSRFPKPKSTTSDKKGMNLNPKNKKDGNSAENVDIDISYVERDRDNKQAKVNKYSSVKELCKMIEADKETRKSFVGLLFLKCFPLNLIVSSQRVAIPTRSLLEVCSVMTIGEERERILSVMNSGERILDIKWLIDEMRKAGVITLKAWEPPEMILTYTEGSKRIAIASYWITDDFFSVKEVESIKRVKLLSVKPTRQKKADVVVLHSGIKKKNEDNGDDYIKPEKEIAEKGKEAESKPVEILFNTPPKKNVASKETVNVEKKKKERMSRGVFIKKFCTYNMLISDAVFTEAKKDCDQFYFYFKVSEKNVDEVKVFFCADKFRAMLYKFLEKERMEYTESNNYLFKFLREDEKGEMKTRYFLSRLDRAVIKAKIVSLNVPMSLLEGMKLDVGYRGGYMLGEMDKIYQSAVETKDQEVIEEIEIMRSSIKSGNLIDCINDKGNSNG